MLSNTFINVPGDFVWVALCWNWYKNEKETGVTSAEF